MRYRLWTKFHPFKQFKAVGKHISFASSSPATLKTLCFGFAGRARVSITPLLSRGARAVQAAKAVLAGQYASVTLAAHAFDLDGAQLVHFYIKKWKGTQVEDALVAVECKRAEDYLAGDV
ncbi:hypothetical protein CYMTET_26630 [Cymbomonas tetramitiformis]|uniref:Uncharacterized protein n=1 Tax=Cymbomonas tetramitiformis TaxID=36881 RepID=A0AAE0FRH3_9CHLO|nr:hypothetical protein CYMTET_26630 [Cymbomonas tetramitiformis]